MSGKRISSLAASPTLTARPKGGERQPPNTGGEPASIRSRHTWPMVEEWLRAEPEITAKALMQRLRDSCRTSILPVLNCVRYNAACNCGATSR